jgi:hypothetical protein
MSPNLLRNEFEVELAGQRHVCRADFDAIRNIERATKKGIVRLAEAFRSTDFGLEEAATVIYFCRVSSGEKNLKFEDVGQAVADEGAVKLIPAMMEFALIGMSGATLGKQEAAKEPQAT